MKARKEVIKKAELIERLKRGGVLHYFLPTRGYGCKYYIYPGMESVHAATAKALIKSGKLSIRRQVRSTGEYVWKQESEE